MSSRQEIMRSPCSLRATVASTIRRVPAGPYAMRCQSQSAAAGIFRTPLHRRLPVGPTSVSEGSSATQTTA